MTDEINNPDYVDYENITIELPEKNVNTIGSTFEKSNLNISNDNLISGNLSVSVDGNITIGGPEYKKNLKRFKSKAHFCKYFNKDNGDTLIPCVYSSPDSYGIGDVYVALLEEIMDLRTDNNLLQEKVSSMSTKLDELMNSAK